MYKIAIAVRNVDLFLEAAVVRNDKGDIYVNVPRPRSGWSPHASYHVNGEHHLVSFSKKSLIQQKQKPDPTFIGTEAIDAFGLSSDGYKPVHKCDVNAFDAVFEIDVALLRPDKFKTHVYVDLVEPGVHPRLIPGAKVLLQKTYKDTEPWIVVTFLET